VAYRESPSAAGDLPTRARAEIEAIEANPEEEQTV
jgi:hypothetical protein